MPDVIWENLTPEEKKAELYRKQKELLDMFLERNAISKAQYDKSLSDLTEKMGMSDKFKFNGESMEEILRKLTDKNDKTAYEFAKQLGVESVESDCYLAMIPMFAELLQDKSSYVRTRAFVLICNQARWANDGQLAVVFDRMLLLLNDPKPTVVRQCLNALHEVALFRPELSDKIENALAEMDVSKYKDSMSPLILKDVEALRNLF